MKILKPAEIFVKKLLTKIIKLFINQHEVDINNVIPSDIKKILIVHLDRKVGNLILSTPMIEAAKKVFTNAEVDILVASTVKILLDSNPYLNKVFGFNHSSFIKNPFKLFLLKRLLITQHYNLTIESSNPSGTSFLNGFITNLTNAKYKVGFNGGSGALFTNIHITQNKADHYFISKLNLITSFAEENFILAPKIFVNKDDVESVRSDLVKGFNLNPLQKFIGIWIGARDKKKWDIQNFYSIYNKLKSESSYFPILMFGIEEMNQYNQIDKSLFNSFYFNDLGKLKNFISCCDIFISGDTGPLHYAYALNVITIGIFLQDNYGTYGYIVEGKNFIIKPDKTELMIENVINICKSI